MHVYEASLIGFAIGGVVVTLATVWLGIDLPELSESHEAPGRLARFMTRMRREAKRGALFLRQIEKNARQ